MRSAGSRPSAAATLALMYDSSPSRVVSQNQPFPLLSNSWSRPSAREDSRRDSSGEEPPPDLKIRLMLSTRLPRSRAHHARISFKFGFRSFEIPERLPTAEALATTAHRRGRDA